MMTFILAIVTLVLGYFIYGSVVERVFGVDNDNPTPAHTKSDGVDYIPMPRWKVFLIQFLNIDGTGSIFGAISGILFGPAAYLWIVFGCIFAGAVHDFSSGIISVRKGGVSLPEIIGDELGDKMRHIARIVAIGVLVMYGAVFITTPSNLIALMWGDWSVLSNPIFWALLIFAYYIIATILPIDKIIGRFYPLFGFVMLLMGAMVFVGIFTNGGATPSITETFKPVHPQGLALFPFLFLTITCGAISGFHGTQSPMMARCLNEEKDARLAFYGAMIIEGILALIWATAAIKFCNGGYLALSNMMTVNGGVNPSIVINAICSNWFGTIGYVIAILGVVLAPITSGDTALRSARLIVADIFKINQETAKKRFMIAIPIFILAGVLASIDFSIIWRYNGWMNQTMATLTLWAATLYLYRHDKFYFITLIPAIFMTTVVSTYLFVAPEALALTPGLSYMIGGTLTVIFTIAAFLHVRKS